MNRTRFRPAAVAALAFLAPAAAADPTPLMTVTDREVLRDDFSTPKPLDKANYKPGQGTRWAVEDGVLRGRPSTPEFRANKQDHFGYEPRLSIPACPEDFVIRFDVRFLDGKPSSIVPFVEFGHHMARVAWPGGGEAKLLGEKESVLVAPVPGFKLEPGRWYQGLAEVKGEEVVVQFVGGPTVYGKHQSFAGPKSGFGVAGTQEGTVELDNLTVWSVKADPQPGWAAVRDKLLRPAPVAVKKKVAPKN